MKPTLGMALLFLISFSVVPGAYAFDQEKLEHALQDEARVYGAYGDESVICGGELVAYKVTQETDSAIDFTARITMAVNYCERETEVDCTGRILKVNEAYKIEKFQCIP